MCRDREWPSSTEQWWTSFDDFPTTDWLNTPLVADRIWIDETPLIDDSLFPTEYPPIPDAVNVVVFHAPCADGTAAAFAVGKRFPDAILVGVNRGVSERFIKLPGNVAGSHVVLVDYVYPELIMEELLAVAASVTVIDHHPSEVPLLDHFTARFPKKFQYVYAEHVCAAVLAWRWLHSQAELPLLYHYINDNDTGSWELENVGNFMTGLNVDAPVFSAEIFDFSDFFIFEKAIFGGADYVRSRVVLGMIARLTERRDIAQIAQRSSDRRLAAAPDLVCRAVNSSDLSGSLHRALLSGSFDSTKRPSDISMQYYFIDATGGWKVALRSSQDSDVDVGVIAQYYGGGGHKHAASFSWDEDLDLVFSEPTAPPNVSAPVIDLAGDQWVSATAEPEAQWWTPHGKDDYSDHSELDRGWTYSWTKQWYRENTVSR